MKHIHRALSLILSAAMLLMLLPTALLAQADSFPSLGTVTLSDSGVLTWDPFPGADHYFAYVSVAWQQLDTTSFDLATHLKTYSAATDDYSVTIAARDAEGNDIAWSNAPIYHYVAQGKMNPPAEVYWSGTYACFSEVEDAESYIVQLYAGDMISANIPTTGTAVDLADYLYDTGNSFYFDVLACRYGYEMSDQSDVSEKINGIYPMMTPNVYFVGDDLCIGTFQDGAGREADAYLILADPENPMSLGEIQLLKEQGDSINIKALLDAANAPAGTYHFWAVAQRRIGDQYFFVSNYSNTAEYVYVGNALSITQQTLSVTVHVGEPAELYVEATGVGLDYQWYMLVRSNWVLMENKTDATLEVRPIKTGTGRYRCVVTDENGDSVTSDRITVIAVDLLKGDVETNDTINMGDAFLLYRAVSGQVTLTKEQEWAGDMDGNGILNMADAFALYRIVSGQA
ncbi:MAG: hypothetical protein IJU16_06220 [Clostridia bacterium]|nr:hypothetical protein [Clostridia bacterium]